MTDDIKFIRDEIQEKKLKQLQEILDVLTTKPTDIDTEVGTRFFYSLLKATQRVKERKKQESEKQAKLMEIDRQLPPKPVMEPRSLQKIWKEEEHPKAAPHLDIPRPEDLLMPKEKMPDVKDHKEPEEKPKVEEAIKNISKNYPITIFKSPKGETISQITIIYQKGKVIYHLTEPEIDMRLVQETKNLIQKKFEKDNKKIKDEGFMTKNIKKAFKKIKIDYTDEYKEEIKYFIYKDMLGLGRIDPLVHDDNIRTIACDGINKPVKITLGPGIEMQTNILYTKKEELDDQIKHLGLKMGKQVSENNPIVEGTFFHFRVQATLGMGETQSKFFIKNLP
ncbi:MAG: hypothetical protein KKA79_07360 [Nanoarchaeota archaeon]|nr:hypothetical protein [Nanoarchaeota archaeon]